MAHIIGVGHLSVLRFGSAVFRIEGISKVCLAQLTRSKHLDYLVRSSRYCDESEAEVYFPVAFETLDPENLNVIDKHVQDAFQLYKELREGGFTKQDARYILPQAQETELYVCGNYQAWVDFIKLRLNNSYKLLRLLSLVFPMTWIRLEDQVEVSTGDIIYELNICWDEYKENKEDPEYDEMVAQLHEVAAARLLNQKKCIIV